MSDIDDEARLRDIPDREAGRLWDEWFFSFTREEMEVMYENGTVSEEFDLWVASRSTKH